MNTKPDTLSEFDAIQALAKLAAWTPPDGIAYTVSCTRYPDDPEARVVTVVMSAVADAVCVLSVGMVPDAEVLDMLTATGQALLDAAWGQPACSGLADEPVEVATPDGPINLRATGHPVYDTSKMGRDS